MAISMSSATIDDSARQTLLSKSIDGTITNGGAKLNKTSAFYGLREIETGAVLAGVTATFAQNVTSEIDNYITDVNTIIEKLSSVNTNVAFKGSGIENALNNFIEGVKEVAKNYTTALRNAENQIINSVAQAYQTQDTDVASNLNSDQSSMVDSNTFTAS